MKNIIASIRDALDKEAYLPALALALTIPDVCGQVAYPRCASKERYQHWFREYVEPHYADEKGITQKGNARNAFMNAKACYALRNEVLHGGSSDIHVANKKLFGKELTAPRYVYELYVNAANGYGYVIENYGSENSKSTVRIKLDIGTLCRRLCDAAERFGETVSDEFAEHDVRYVDIGAWAQRHGHDSGTEIDWPEVVKKAERESQTSASPE